LARVARGPVVVDVPLDAVRPDDVRVAELMAERPRARDESLVWDRVTDVRAIRAEGLGRDRVAEGGLAHGECDYPVDRK
jgi:hypothetical protein